MLEQIIHDHSQTLVLGGLAASAVAVLWLVKRESNLPPGPKGLPVLGVFPSFGKALAARQFPHYVVSLHEQYGNIVSIKLGCRLFVFIKDGKLLKEAFATENFQERPFDRFPAVLKLVDGELSGLFFNNGPQQFAMRKFALSTFRDFGVGKKSLDECVQSECEAFCQYLEDVAKSSDGVVDDIRGKMQQSAANVIHDIIFGFRYDYGDSKWQELRGKLRKFFEVNFLGLPENFFPFLRYLPFVNWLVTANEIKDFYESNQYLQNYVEYQVNEHKTTYCEGEIRDFIDLYIKYENQTTEHFTRWNIFNTIMDIFRAGSDTTANSLAWCIQYLVKFPEIQEELRKEVDEKIGDQVFERKDRDRLIKTRAFVYEVLRYVSIAPVMPPHTVRAPTKLGDYVLPEDCFVFGSLYAIHHDKDYWKDPETFRIDRFIDERGELFLHENHFLPFGTGKRVCIGRHIALIELLLFLVSILQNFKFEDCPAYSDMSDEQETPLLRSPRSFHFKVIKR